MIRTKPSPIIHERMTDEKINKIKIEDFRIKENALQGFTIERLIKKRHYDLLLFWRYRIIERWEPIDFHGWYGDYSGNIARFTEKEKAIEHISKLCQEDKYYYPLKFE